jgi:hypothetical protein
MALMDDAEHSVPELWRAKFAEIAAALAEGDFKLSTSQVSGVDPIDQETADLIAANVTAYGDGLAPLHEATWEHSIYRWMDGYWQVLVDLSTTNEPVSDLTLHAKVYEADCSRLTIDSVHVP